MLKRLEAQDFRCFERLDLPLGGRSVGLVGPNGSGKTSVLEALYFLAFGKSFRTADRRQLVRGGSQAFAIRALVEDSMGQATLVTQWNTTDLRMELGGRPATGVGEMAARLSVHLIDPSVHRLIEGVPQERRRLLDTGVFHVEPGYLTVWRRFRRALKQRNAALRSPAALHEAPLWDHAFVASAMEVDGLRRGYVNRWSDAFSSCAAELDLEGGSLRYRSGWSEGTDLSRALADALSRDLAMGTCTVGPHRGDVAILLGGLSARRRVSRGEQKLLASALVLSQLSLESSHGASSVVLVDDPAAELDVDNLGKFLGALAHQPAQVIATATFPAALAGLSDLLMFHVKPDGLAQML